MPAYLSVHGRCEPCARAVEARKNSRNRELGRRGRPGVPEAVRRAGRCRDCGATPDMRRLTAHLPGGGVHPPDPDAYIALCDRCHRKREQAER
jgi:hypothetical protein